MKKLRQPETHTLFEGLPKFVQVAVIGITLLFALSFPLLYDSTVPEVAGDIRWHALHVTTLVILALFTLGCTLKPPTHLTRPPAVVWAVLLLGLSAILSTIDTINPLRSWFFLKHFLGYIALFFIFYSIKSPFFTRAIIWCFALPLGANALLGIVQYFNWHDYTLANILPFWPRTGFIIDTATGYFRQSAVPGATLANKNLAASYTVLMLPMALFLAVTVRPLIGKILLTGLSVLAATFLVYSRSRASWVAATLAVICFVIYVIFSPVWRQMLITAFKKPTFWILCITAFTALSFLAQQLSPIRSHGISRPAAEQLSTLAKLDKNEFGPRIAYNLNSPHIVKDYPLNGTGIGTFHTIYPVYHNVQFNTPHHGYNVLARPQRAHNDAMQAFVELGLIGGALFSSLWFFALFMAWKLGRPPQKNLENPPNSTFHPILPLFLITSITGLSLNALADFPLQMPTAPAFLFAFLGLLTNLYGQRFPLTSVFSLPKQAISKTGAFVLTVALVASAVAVNKDDTARRQGAQHLKFAMQRLLAGVTDAETLKQITLSYEKYPYNARMREFRAIIIHNYLGKPTLTPAYKVKIASETLKYDPYAANHHINLANLYLTQAQKAKTLRDQPAFTRNLNKAKEHEAMLLKVAGFSYFTKGVTGMIALMEENWPKAHKAFQEALAINPKFKLAQQGLAATQRHIGTK